MSSNLTYYSGNFKSKLGWVFSFSHQIYLWVTPSFFFFFPVWRRESGFSHVRPLVQQASEGDSFGRLFHRLHDCGWSRQALESGHSLLRSFFSGVIEQVRQFHKYKNTLFFVFFPETNELFVLLLCQWTIPDNPRHCDNIGIFLFFFTLVLKYLARTSPFSFFFFSSLLLHLLLLLPMIMIWSYQRKTTRTSYWLQPGG